MAEYKHRHHIVTDLKVPAQVAADRDPKLDESETLVTWLDESIVPGASHMVTIWYTQATPQTQYPAHTHEADEIIGFFGSDPANPHDLGGEIEFWLEDEKYLITQSCLIFVPRGMVHCPLVIHRVDRPIFHFTSMIGGTNYVRNDV